LLHVLHIIVTTVSRNDYLSLLYQSGVSEVKLPYGKHVSGKSRQGNSGRFKAWCLGLGTWRRRKMQYIAALSTSTHLRHCRLIVVELHSISKFLTRRTSPHLKRFQGSCRECLKRKQRPALPTARDNGQQPPVVSPTPLRPPLPSNTYTPSAQPSYNPCNLLHTTLEPTQTPTHTYTVAQHDARRGVQVAELQ
jgi:hypothetical protein